MSLQSGLSLSLCCFSSLDYSFWINSSIPQISRDLRVNTENFRYMFIIVLTLAKMHRWTWGHTISEGIWSSQGWLSNLVTLSTSNELYCTVTCTWRSPLVINGMVSLCLMIYLPFLFVLSLPSGVLNPCLLYSSCKVAQCSQVTQIPFFLSVMSSASESTSCCFLLLRGWMASTCFLIYDEVLWWGNNLCKCLCWVS